MLFALLSRFLRCGRGLAMRTHLESEDGTCSVDLTKTYSTSSAAHFVI